MRYVYGPVMSRRLGRSLGIDPIPLKTCNWNCAYCQLGRTAAPTGERREYTPAEAVVAEAQAALAEHAGGDIDWVTFVGSGEPTLHRRLGWMIRRVRSLTERPIAVITNGSLLHDPQVRYELLAADAVLPSLDAGSEELFLRINRPLPTFRFAEHVAGLVDFRREYDGKLWVEVMLIRGLNDSDQALVDLAAVLSDIRPDEVHIVLPVRPPCQSWVRPASEERQTSAVAMLGNAARLIQPLADTVEPAGTDVADAVVAVVSRHPLSDEEIQSALARWSPAEIDEALGSLRERGEIQAVSRFGQRFWSHAESHYGPVRRRRGSRAATHHRRFHLPGGTAGRDGEKKSR